MSIRKKLVVSLLCCGAMALFAGCATSPAGTPAVADTNAGDQRAPDTRSQAQLEETSVIDDVLAERRRDEFPEIETAAAGFTITEQVRISGDAHARYDQAAGLLGQERYDEAIALLSELTQEAPELTAPHVDLGIAYRLVGDLQGAAAALETAALLSPEHPIVRNELGIVYRKAGRFDDARAQYEQALAVFSDFHFARRNLAVLCDLYLADAECALQNYQMYLDSVGEDPEVEIWIADLASRSGQNP